MTTPGDVPLPAYGLPSNPFVRRVLKPHESDDDHGCVCLVDGWRDLDVAARSFIKGKITDKRPAHFVLVGADKTGRTSIANYLLRLFADERGGMDVVIENRHGNGPNSGTYSIKSNMTQWAQKFLTYNVTRNLGLSKTTLDLLRGLSENSWNPALMSEALINLETDLRKPRQNGQELFLAAIFEHGMGDELVMKIKESFEDTRAVVVTTIDDLTDSDDLVSSVGPGFDGLVLRLRSIQGADVASFIRHQWERVGSGIENPFDLAAVADVFDSPRPVGQVVNMLGWLLDIKNDGHAPHGGAPLWPADRTLACGEGVLRSHVRNYDLALLTARR